MAPPPQLGQPGWWRDRTFYEAFVRSFADSNGDGVGDLTGLIDHLDYLNDGDPSTPGDLGVTGLWLMPTFPSPSYHGYDVTDYRGVNRDYGTLDDLRRLVAEAHKRNIGVLLDLPLNHTSDEHPWFIASAAGEDGKADWYVWSDQPEGNGWQPSGKRFYYAAFGADLPDLNLRNPAVVAEVTKDAELWLDDVGVDGFRLDAAKHLIEDGSTTENTPGTHAWWRTFRTAVETRKPGALLLGEVYDTPQISSSYVPADLDLTFDFGAASAMVGAAQSGDASSVENVLGSISTLYPASSGYGSFLTNHDQDRIASQLAADVGKLKVAADLLLLGPGVPFVYYGEEIGMTGAKPDERIRTPMRWTSTGGTAGFTTGQPWEALSDDPRSVNVADELPNGDSLVDRYAVLIKLRGEHPALSSGTWSPVVSDQTSVVASLRVAPTETALVLTNVAPESAAPTLSLASGPLCGQPAVDVALGPPGAAAPTITPTGGFEGYRPFAALPPQSSAVLIFHP